MPEPLNPTTLDSRWTRQRTRGRVVPSKGDRDVLPTVSNKTYALLYVMVFERAAEDAIHGTTERYESLESHARLGVADIVSVANAERPFVMSSAQFEFLVWGFIAAYADARMEMSR